MGRSPCCDKNGLKKGPWTPEEDLKLIHYIQIHGPGNWRILPKNAGLQRCGKSCRLRWTNYLRPDIKRGRFSFEEEEIIIQLHGILGNKWSAIAARLPGRTDNEIKNYWNTHIRKRLLRMGIDPVTHSPRLDLMDLSSILSLASTQLNLPNLLGLQTLVNPELLRLATTVSVTNHENPEMLLQNLQDNQLLNTHLPNQAPVLEPSLFQSPAQETPTCTTSTVPSCSGTQFQNQTQTMQGISNMGQYGGDLTNLSCQNLQESLGNTLNTGGYNHSFTFDSVMSTPMSSPTPLNSSASTFINSGTEDEKESYCSNVLKFDIPESLGFDDFL
ncbi:hypothetical protein NMG60_11003047 [Bertholletia excelsa]